MKVKKTVIVIGFILLMGIVVAVFSQVLGRVANDETQSESPSEREVRVSQPSQNDPVGKKAVLGYLLRFPIFLDIASIEIGLAGSQKVYLARAVEEEENQLESLRHANLPAEQHNKKHDTILKATDDRIKRIFSPIQYVRFRDWVIEQWVLERNQRALRHGLSMVPVTPATNHWLEFMRTRLNLSRDDAQAMNQLIHQVKQDILPLRKNLVELAADPTVPLSEIQKEGKQVVKQVHIRIQKLESDLTKKLPLDKRRLYMSYTELPDKGGSDVKGGTR